MKKTPCSIGGYILKNVENTRGHEGYGFIAELWKGKKFIGTLEDYGDGGGVNSRLSPELSDEDRELTAKEVHADMIKLLELSEASDNSLARGNWDITAYGTMVGFAELLLELTELTKFAKKFGKEQEGKPHAIIQIGSSWFEPLGWNFDKTKYMGVGLKYAQPEDYISITQQAIKNYNDKPNAVLLRFIEGPVKWDLSLEDYAGFIKKARECNSFTISG